MPRPKGKSTGRSRILKAAKKLFAKKGFWQVNFNQIAEKIGIAQPSIFYHFPGKEHLFLSLIEEISKSNREMVEEAKLGTSSSRIESHFLANAEWVRKCPDEALVTLQFYLLACSSSEANARYKEYSDRAQKEIEEMLKESDKADSTAKDLRLDSKIVYSFLIGHLLTNHLEKKSGTSQKRGRDAEWKRFLEKFVPRK